MFTFLVCLVGFSPMQGPFCAPPVKGKGSWFVRGKFKKERDLTGVLFICLRSFFFSFLFSVCFPFSSFAFSYVCFIFRYFSDSYVERLPGFDSPTSPWCSRWGEIDRFRCKSWWHSEDLLGGFNSWKRWAKSNGLPYLPTNSFHVAMYLQVILQSASSASPIKQAVYTIYRLGPWVGWLSQGFLSLYGPVHDASKHVLAKPKCRKEPITPKMLQQLAESIKAK